MSLQRVDRDELGPLAGWEYGAEDGGRREGGREGRGRERGREGEGEGGREGGRRERDNVKSVLIFPMDF